MALQPISAWAEQVDRIFGTRPRDGTRTDTVWLPRPELEDEVAKYLATDSPHVCIDGPTGTGKTSLARTQLAKAQRLFLPYQFSRSLEWSDFCRDIVTQSFARTPVQSKWQVEFSLDGLKPRLAVRTQSQKERLEHQRQLEDQARKWTPSDLASLISATNSIFLLDDFEKATKGVVEKIADTCKLLTSQYSGKCVIIGTGPIFVNLIDADRSLFGRVKQVSVPTIKNKNDIWYLLTQGFDQLGFNHPASRVRNNRTPRNIKENADCITDVQQATGGLPKHINELGGAIVRSAASKLTDGEVRRQISRADVRIECQDMVRMHVRAYTRQFPMLRRLAEEHLEVRMVLRAIYSLGVNQIHDFDEVRRAIEKYEVIHPTGSSISDRQIHTGIDLLREADLLVVTGGGGAVVFASDPTLTHTFGLVCEDPERFGFRREDYGSLGQLSLPMV
jgi:AAA domain